MLSANPSRLDSVAVDRFEPGGSEHHSLALALLLRGLREDRKSVVLDLGPAIGANVAFFARYPCKLHIADIYQTLTAQRRENPGNDESLARSLKYNLPGGDGGAFDLVLAWDLLNYLTPAELQTLGRHLAALCKPATSLYALVSTRKQIPDLPMSYHILDPESLRYECHSANGRRSPQYKEPDLNRLLPDFAVETTFLLRNGM